jgi:hypothetical protein
LTHSAQLSISPPCMLNTESTILGPYLLTMCLQGNQDKSSICVLPRCSNKCLPDMEYSSRQQLPTDANLPRSSCMIRSQQKKTAPQNSSYNLLNQ